MSTSPTLPSTSLLRRRFTDSGVVPAAALSLTSGFADAVGYLQAGIFAANMTGNTVLAGIWLAQGQWLHAARQGSAILAFFLGALLGRLSRRAAGDVPWLALLLEAVLLAVAGLRLDDHTVVIALIAAAMGIQATAVPKFAGAAVSTVVITSTLARLAETALDRLAALLRIGKPAGGGAPGRLLFGTWLCYGLGAAVAVLLVPVLEHPLLAAAALVAVFSLLSVLNAAREA